MVEKGFLGHNEMARYLWRDFKEGLPWCVPFIVRTPFRFFLQEKTVNTKGYTFKNYYNYPDVMMTIQLDGQKWRCFNLWQDREMGLLEVWDGINVDFHGALEEVWLGNKLFFLGGKVLYSVPAFLVERITYNLEETPIEFRKSIIRGDRFKFTTEMYR